MEYCDHFCSECGAPVVTKLAEAVHKSFPSQAPAPSKTAKSVPAQAKHVVQTTVSEPTEKKTDEEQSGGGSSGCSVIFWLLVFAGIIFGCYYYIYLPYTENKQSESGYTYGYDATGTGMMQPSDVEMKSVQPEESAGKGSQTNQIDSAETTGRQSDTTTSVNPQIPTNSQFAPQPILPQYKIELLNFVWGPRQPKSNRTSIGPFRQQPTPIIVAEGEILNISQSPLPQMIQAIVIFQDVEGNEISRESVIVNRLPIYVGEYAKLHLESNYDSRMYKAKVELRDPNGDPYLVKKDTDYSIRVMQ